MTVQPETTFTMRHKRAICNEATSMCTLIQSRDQFFFAENGKFVTCRARATNLIGLALASSKNHTYISLCMHTRQVIQHDYKENRWDQKPITVLHRNCWTSVKNKARMHSLSELKVPGIIWTLDTALCGLLLMWDWERETFTFKWNILSWCIGI